MDFKKKSWLLIWWFYVIAISAFVAQWLYPNIDFPDWVMALAATLLFVPLILFLIMMFIERTLAGSEQ